MELGAGNGSVSRLLNERVGAAGQVVAIDIDTSFLGDVPPNIEVRRLDVTVADIGEDEYDLVVTRAVLHHLPTRREVLGNLLRATKPGGHLYVEEPDLYPTLTTAGTLREFWDAFLPWAATHEIDYFVGRSIAPWLADLGADVLEAIGLATFYPGGSPFAIWWQQGIAVVADTMLADGAVTREQIDDFMASYSDAQLWTTSIAFTQTTARKPSLG